LWHSQNTQGHGFVPHTESQDTDNQYINKTNLNKTKSDEEEEVNNTAEKI